MTAYEELQTMVRQDDESIGRTIGRMAAMLAIRLDAIEKRLAQLEANR